MATARTLVAPSRVYTDDESRGHLRESASTESAECSGAGRTERRAQAPGAAGDRSSRVQLRLGYARETQLPIAGSLACFAIGLRGSVLPDLRRRKRPR